MDKYGKAARLLFGGAGLLLVFGACSDDQSPAAGSLAPIVTGGAGATTQVGGTTAVEVSTPLPPGATAAPVDGAALLQQAVAATSAGYHFNQTATVDGVVALTIDGDRLSDGARLAVSNEAGLVFYIITPDGTWLMPENGEWEADDSAPPAVDPIAALSAPTAVSVAANDGNTVQLVVTVPLGSLGIQGDGDASLQVALVGGALNTLSFSTPTADGRTATATVIFGPVVDSTPVEAPI